MAVQKFRQQTAQEAQNKELATKLADARSRYPDADAAIAPAAKAILGDAAVPPVVKALVDGSPVMIDLLYVLGSKADELTSFVNLARTNPLEAVRKIAVMENLVKGEMGKTTSGQAQRGEDGKFQPADKTTPEKKETKAPPPAHEVAGRGAPPPDEAESAVKSNDFRAFKAAADRKDIARRQGR